MKPPIKSNSSLKISHLHKSKLKMLTKKSKIWEGHGLSMLCFPFSAAEGRVYNEEHKQFQPHSRRNEEATVT